MTAFQFDLSSVTRPVSEARGLPNPFYTDPAVFEAEKERVFFRNWAALGFATDCPNPGDAEPLTFLGQPLVMVRDHDGVLRVFQNICRHRGMILVQKAGPIARAIRCPYHSWSYELTGQLRTTPHVGGPGMNRHDAIKRESLGLIEVRSHTWLGIVFINIDGKAAPFEEFAGDAIARWGEFDHPLHRCGDEGTFTMEVNANWKLVYENYMEGYHVFAVHPKLLKFAPMNVRWSGEWDRHVFYNDYIFPELDEGRGAGLPHYPGLSKSDARRGLWFLCFPHFAAEVFPDQFSVLVSYPVAPDKTREELHVFLIGDAATSDNHRAAREATLKMWDDLNREDLGMLELLQQGRLSPAYDGGCLSPHWEGPTHDFGRRVVERILS